MNTGLIFDLVLVVIFIIAMVSGFIGGLIKMLLKLAAAVAAAVVGYFLSIPVASWIFNSFVSPGLTETLAGKILEYNQSGAAIELPFGLQSLIVPSQISAAATEAEANAAAAEIMQNTLAGPITGTIRILAFVVIFLIVLLILLWIARAARKVNNVPVLGAFNRVLGGLLGAVIGFIICYVVALLCNFAVQSLANTLSPETMSQINGAVVYNWILGTDLLSLIQ